MLLLKIAAGRFTSFASVATMFSSHASYQGSSCLKFVTVHFDVQAILDVVVNLQFQMVENLWRHFWAENPKQVYVAAFFFSQPGHHTALVSCVLCNASTSLSFFFLQ